MLVLTRKLNERILIGDDIVVSVQGVKGDKVLIGIEAPSDVSIHRQEVRARLNRQKKEGGAA